MPWERCTENFRSLGPLVAELWWYTWFWRFLRGGAATAGAIAINQNTSRGIAIRKVYRKFQKPSSIGCWARSVHRCSGEEEDTLSTSKNGQIKTVIKLAIIRISRCGFQHSVVNPEFYALIQFAVRKFVRKCVFGLGEKRPKCHRIYSSTLAAPIWWREGRRPLARSLDII